MKGHIRHRQWLLSLSALVIASSMLLGWWRPPRWPWEKPYHELRPFSTRKHLHLIEGNSTACFSLDAPYYPTYTFMLRPPTAYQGSARTVLSIKVTDYTTGTLYCHLHQSKTMIGQPLFCSAENLPVQIQNLGFRVCVSKTGGGEIDTEVWVRGWSDRLP